MVFGNKEGISPLIATILLIAFAVALGAMIMNWGANILVSPSSSDCEAVQLVVQAYQNDKPFCYDGQSKNIFFRVRNTGTEPVESIKLITITSTDSTEQDLPDTKIDDGGILQKTISYQKTTSFHGELIPIINDGGKMTACSNAAIVLEDVPDC